MKKVNEDLRKPKIHKKLNANQIKFNSILNLYNRSHLLE